MKRTVLALTLATGIAVGGVSGYLANEDEVQYVKPITLTENTADSPQDRAAFENLRDDLLERGWRGVPGDGAERLYHDSNHDGHLSDLEMGS